MRVQPGIVVHFKLSIDLPPYDSFFGIRHERGKAGCEILLLIGETKKLALTSFDVMTIDVYALNLLGECPFFE